MNFPIFGRSMLACLLLATSASTYAQPPTYSYVEGGVGAHDVGTLDEWDQEGFWAGFSFQLGESFYVDGRAQRYRRDLVAFLPIDAEDPDLGLEARTIGLRNLDFARASLGYRLPIGGRTDLNVELGIDYRGRGRFVDDRAYRAAVGVRSRFWERFEGRAMVGYRNEDGFPFGNYLITLEGAYHFSDLLAATLQLESDELDTHTARVGARLMF